MKRLFLAFFAVLLAGAASAAAGEPAAFQELKRGSLKALLKAHEGHAVAVHFWGVTCGPCLAELPEWGKLKAEHPGAALVLIHADPLPGRQEALTEIVRKARLAGADNWFFGGESQERLRFEADPRWQGELPFTLLVSAGGEKKPLVGPADMNEVTAFLTRGSSPASAALPGGTK